MSALCVSDSVLQVRYLECRPDLVNWSCIENPYPQRLVGSLNTLSRYDCLRHANPAGTGLSLMSRHSYTPSFCADILYSKAAFHHTWKIVKKSFSFRGFKSPTLTLAVLQVVHPDLTFLCGRLIRKADISTAAIIGSFLVVSRVLCAESVDPGSPLANDPKDSSLHHIFIRSDAQDLLFGLT